MSNNTRTILFIATALIIVGGIGYYNIKQEGLSSTDDIDIPGAVVDSENNGAGNAIVTSDKSPQAAEIKSGGTGEKKPNATSIVTGVAVSYPDLDRPVIFPGGYSAEKAKEVTGQIAILTEALRADNSRFNEWMDLGLLLKSIEDYEGARVVWEYAGAIRPGNSLSFANLGTLYGYYLNQPIKAEANLLHAIENEPRFLDFYARMTDFYLDVMKNKSRAADFLDRAIAKYPEWIEIKDLRTYITR